MENQKSPDPLSKWIDSLLDGSLSQQDADQLVARLESDEQACQLYVEMCDLDNSLARLVSSDHSLQASIQAIRSGGHSDEAIDREDSEEISGPAIAGSVVDALTAVRRSPPVLFLVAAPAAALILIGACLWLDIVKVTFPTAVEQVANNEEDPPKIDSPTVDSLAATITGVVDGVWTDDTEQLGYGEPIPSGRMLDLKSGLVQLSFESGAKSILQGPARLSVDSKSGVVLHRGKLTSLVPVQAIGFRVRTPQAEVVDLGTEFGVYVAEDASTKVDVFQGEVVLWQVDANGKIGNEPMSLVANQSTTLSGGGNKPTVALADSTRFARDFNPRLTPQQLPPLPVDRQLVLWLAADTLVNKDAEGRMIGWEDILTGDNQSADSAWQPEESARPRYVEDAIGGKPAVRFDGLQTSMSTTPFVTTPDQTVFIVCSPLFVEEPKLFAQLLNYNGPPSARVSEGQVVRILQIGMPGRFFPGQFRGMVYTGFHDDRHVQVGEVVSTNPIIGFGETAVLAYRYDTDANTAELLVNGVSQGIATAPPGQSVTSRKIIGRHPFQDVFDGYIAEVVIYNDALKTDEIDEVQDYLMKKYEVE